MQVFASTSMYSKKEKEINFFNNFFKKYFFFFNQYRFENIERVGCENHEQKSFLFIQNQKKKIQSIIFFFQS